MNGPMTKACIAIVSALMLTLIIPGVTVRTSQHAPVEDAGGTHALCLDGPGTVLSTLRFSRNTAQASRAGLDFGLEVSNIRLEGSRSRDWNTAIERLQNLVPCNEQQQTYKETQLEYFGWLGAAEACRPLHAAARTLGDVGLWLACIGPVNAAVVAAARQTSDAHRAMLGVPCTGGYQPSGAAPMPPGALYATTVNTILTVKDVVDQISEFRDLLSIARSTSLTADELELVEHLLFFESMDSAVERTWARTDVPVSELRSTRSWIWGPAPISDPVYEPYAESPNGEREVTYFDKSRMEINDPSADSSSVWFVTQGHLAKELMTGEVQVGDAQFEQSVPATVHVAGDPDPNAPSYALFGTRMQAGPLPAGSTIVQTLASSGQIGENQDLATHNVTAAHHFAETDHTVASVFWNFMNSSGLVYEDGEYVEGPLFESPVYAVGLPLTEAYWVDVKVGGQDRWVLAQCFERRCLTYNPANPEGWEVEAANVGQHYYEWRYGGDPVEPPVQLSGNYTDNVIALMEELAASADHVSQLMSDPTLDSQWITEFDQQMVIWKSLSNRLSGFEAPSDVQALHNSLLQALELVESAAEEFSKAVHNDDVDALDRVEEQLTEALNLLPFGQRWSEVMGPGN